MRGADQKQVIVLMKGDFLSVLDENLEDMGFGDRAQFIRTAVLEKLQAEGVDVEKVLASPPSRAGKGGRPKKMPSAENAMLNDEVHPNPAPMKEGAKYPKRPPAKKTKTKE